LKSSFPLYPSFPFLAKMRGRSIDSKISISCQRPASERRDGGGAAEVPFLLFPHVHHPMGRDSVSDGYFVSGLSPPLPPFSFSATKAGDWRRSARSSCSLPLFSFSCERGCPAHATLRRDPMRAGRPRSSPLLPPSLPFPPFRPARPSGEAHRGPGRRGGLRHGRGGGAAAFFFPFSLSVREERRLVADGFRANPSTRRSARQTWPRRHPSLFGTHGAARAAGFWSTRASTLALSSPFLFFLFEAQTKEQGRDQDKRAGMMDLKGGAVRARSKCPLPLFLSLPSLRKRKNETMLRAGGGRVNERRIFFFLFLSFLHFPRGGRKVEGGGGGEGTRHQEERKRRWPPFFFGRVNAGEMAERDNPRSPSFLFSSSLLPFFFRTG